MGQKWYRNGRWITAVELRALRDKQLNKKVEEEPEKLEEPGELAEPAEVAVKKTSVLRRRKIKKTK